LQDHSQELKERYLKQASLMTTSYIFSALNLINECDLTYQTVRNKRLHIEIALSRICFLRRLQTGSPFSPEKKTADGSKPLEELPAVENESSPIEKAPEPIPVIPKITKKSNSKSTSTPVTIEENAPVSEPSEKPATPVKKSPASTAPIPKPFSNSILNTPQLGSLFELKSHVEKNEQIAKDNSLELTEANAVAWWNEFRQTISSPSVAVAFKEAIVSLDGNVLRIVVDSVLGKTRIHEENDLLIRFRNAFHDHTLDIEIVVEESEASRESRKPKKSLTVREKYERLVAKNPAMEELKNKLGLVVDHEE
jgi:DNA polymerase-3 subunit gamma/tau